MTSEIDPVEFGKLLQVCHGLEMALLANMQEMKAMERQLHVLADRLAVMEERYRMGKLSVTMILMFVGFALFGVKESIQLLWSKV